MNGANLETARFSLGYMLAWHGIVLVSGSKNGLRRLMRKHGGAA